MSRKSSLLIDSDETVYFQRNLAVITGDREAIALQQIHYWCDLNQKADKSDHFFDAQWWLYNTWAEWHDRDFPFWSTSTIRRVFASLEAKALITTRPHTDRNKGLWVSINYGQLELELQSRASELRVRRINLPHRSVQNEQTPPVQNEQTGLFKVSRRSVQSEQATGDTETNTKTKPKTTKKEQPPRRKKGDLEESHPERTDPAYQERALYYRAFEAAFPEDARTKVLDGHSARQVSKFLYDSGYQPHEVTTFVRAKLESGRMDYRFVYLLEDMRVIRPAPKTNGAAPTAAPPDRSAYPGDDYDWGKNPNRYSVTDLERWEREGHIKREGASHEQATAQPE